MFEFMKRKKTTQAVRNMQEQQNFYEVQNRRLNGAIPLENLNAVKDNIADGWVFMEDDVTIEDYDLNMDDVEVEAAIAIKAEEKQMNEQINAFHEALEASLLTKNQILQRIDVFSRVWILDQNEEITDDAKRLFEDKINGLKEKYIGKPAVSGNEDDQEEIHREERLREALENADQERKEMLERTPGYANMKALKPQVKEQEDQAFSQQRNALLHAADWWLMQEALKKDPKLKNSIVFSVLRRPAQERMVMYYMMEHGYQTKMKPSYIPAAQMSYKPDLEKIKKNGLDFSDLEKIYQTVIAEQDTVELWNQMAQSYEQEWAEQEDEKPGQVKQKEALDNILLHITELQNLSDEYTAHKGNRKLSRRKLKLEREMRNAVKNLGAELQLYRDQYGGNMQPGGEAAFMFENFGKTVEEYAKNNGVEDFETILSMVTGVFNLLAGAAMGTWDLVKEYKAADKMTVAGKTLGIVDNGLRDAKTYVGGVIDKVLGESATTGLAIAGIAVGGVTAGVETYNFVHAGIQKRRGMKAQRRFQELDKNAEQLHLQKEQEAQEKQKEKKEAQRLKDKKARENLIKIQSRIADRKAVTSGCRIVSGLCAVAAGGSTLLGVGVAATVFGGIGTAVKVGGIVAVKCMERISYTDAIDEFFEIEQLMKAQIAEVSARKKLTNWNKKRMKSRLRQELMEQFGFTSEKAFFEALMDSYAAHVYAKIQPWLDDPAKDETAQTEEEAAYLEFVRSLGLDVRQKKNMADEKPGRPTKEMIFQKLMG